MKRALLFASVCLLTLAALFQFAYRPWQLTRGATSEEAPRSMAGDEIIKIPTFNATRAVTIDAAPELIGPWIVQNGRREVWTASSLPGKNPA